MFQVSLIYHCYIILIQKRKAAKSSSNLIFLKFLILYSLSLWVCTSHFSPALILRQKAFPEKEMHFPMCFTAFFTRFTALWKKNQLKTIALTGKTHFHAVVIQRTNLNIWENKRLLRAAVVIKELPGLDRESKARTRSTWWSTAHAGQGWCLKVAFTAAKMMTDCCLRWNNVPWAGEQGDTGLALSFGSCGIFLQSRPGGPDLLKVHLALPCHNYVITVQSHEHHPLCRHCKLDRQKNQDISNKWSFSKLLHKML